MREDVVDHLQPGGTGAAVNEGQERNGKRWAHGRIPSVTVMDHKKAIQEKLKGLLPDLLGIELVEVAPDKVVATLAVRPELCSTGGVLHGGSIMAFADTLGAIGTVVSMPQGATTATLESKTNFVGGAPSGASVRGEATPVHKGRTTQVWQTRITGADGRLVALVTQTQIVMPARS